MRTWTLALFGAVALSANAAFASTVTIDFQGGTGIGTSDFNNGSGTWMENGFNVDWEVWDIYYGVSDTPGPVPSDYTGFRQLADGPTGFDDTSSVLRFSRPDGKPFKLTGVATSETYEGYFVEAFDADPPISLPILREALAFDWELASGGSGKATAATASAANHVAEEFFGPSRVEIPLALASADLSALTVTINQDFDPDAAALKSLDDFGVLSDLGGSQFLVSPLGRRNDLSYVLFDSLTFKLGDHPPLHPDPVSHHPAPVPLPASALMLIAGLGALGAARMRRRA